MPMITDGIAIGAKVSRFRTRPILPPNRTMIQPAMTESAAVPVAANNTTIPVFLKAVMAP